jgi:hypothetical protein
MYPYEIGRTPCGGASRGLENLHVAARGEKTSLPRPRERCREAEVHSMHAIRTRGLAKVPVGKEAAIRAIDLLKCGGANDYRWRPECADLPCQGVDHRRQLYKCSKSARAVSNRSCVPTSAPRRAGDVPEFGSGWGTSNNQDAVQHNKIKPMHRQDLVYGVLHSKQARLAAASCLLSTGRAERTKHARRSAGIPDVNICEQTYRTRVIRHEPPSVPGKRTLTSTMGPACRGQRARRRPTIPTCYSGDERV